MNYTKGEWKVNKQPNNQATIYVVGDIAAPLAAVFPNKHHLPEITVEQYKANAHLIAAAPEMYEMIVADINTLYALYCRLKPDPTTEAWDEIQRIMRRQQEVINKVEGK